MLRNRVSLLIALVCGGSMRLLTLAFILLPALASAQTPLYI
jgi:hypothetical protein